MLETARRKVVNEGVVHEPGCDIRETIDFLGSHDRRCQQQRQAALRRRGRRDVRSIGDQVPSDAQAGHHGAFEEHTHIRLGARAAIAVQQLVSSDTRKSRVSTRFDREATARESALGVAFGGAHDDVVPATLPLHRAARTAVVAIQGNVMSDQEADRFADEYAQLESDAVGLAARGRPHFDHTLGVSIQPTACVRRNLESRRNIEQVPATVQLREHSLTLSTEQPDVAADRREEAIETDVALSDQ